MEKLSIERVCDHTSERGFSTSRWSPEKDRGKSTRFDKFSDRFSFSDEMSLSDEIVEFLGSEERSEWCDGILEDGLHKRIVKIFYEKEI